MRDIVQQNISQELNALRERLHLSKTRLHFSMGLLAQQAKDFPTVMGGMGSLLRMENDVCARLYALEELEEALSDAIEVDDLQALSEHIGSLQTFGSIVCDVVPGVVH